MVKDILREIKGRKLQFLAILLITTLGVGFFIGIRVTGHDMRITADDYMKSAKVLDLQIMNSYGIDEEMKEDLNTILDSEGLDTYSSNIYATSDTFDGVLNLYELNDSTLSDLSLEEGKLPTSNNEVFIDSQMKEVFDVKLNDEIMIKENDVFAATTLKVVGFGKSSLYLNRSRGHTNLGSGVVDGYAYAYGLDKKVETVTSLRYVFEEDVEVSKQINKIENHQEALLKERFDRLIEPKKKELEDAQAELDDGKLLFEEHIAQMQAEITSGEQSLDAAERELHLALDQLTFGIPTGGTLDERLDLVTRGFEAVKELSQTSIDELRERINTVESEIVKEELQAQVDKQVAELEVMVDEFENGRQEVARGIETYNVGRATLAESKTQLENAIATTNQEFEAAQKQIDDAYKEIENADSGTLFLLERKDAIIGYTDFYNDSERIEAIGTIFPLIFFGVAILITLSTMTQMVEESRMQLGVYKALGFTSLQASMKYVGFAFLAWILGMIFGCLLGFYAIPNLIYNAYRIMYETPDLISNVVLSYLWLPLIVSFLASVGVAFYKSIRVSNENAANLLRPPLPKSGQRILLERWKWLWNKFSFLYKVSFRNLFRNKTRFFMTIIGIAGCSGLLITGFGIDHSINSILDIQFNEIFNYDGIITYSDAKDLDASLYDDYIDIYSDNVSVDNTSVSLYVSDDMEKLSEFFTFNNAISDEDIEIASNFVVITEKLAEDNELNVGDTLKFVYDHKKYELEVSAVIKNHASHYLLVDQKLFEETTLTTVKDNVRFFKGNEVDTDTIKTILEDDKILNVTLANNMEETFREQMGNFDVIIYVIVGAAFLLELIVLTNLISMNISERKKELATLKVLGFYPRELSTYILRENIILTVIALFVGVGFGVFLHKFVVLTAEIDMVMFNRELNISSVIISLVLTLLLSLLINLIMSKRADKVDMNEALKTFDA